MFYFIVEGESLKVVTSADYLRTSHIDTGSIIYIFSEAFQEIIVVPLGMKFKCLTWKMDVEISCFISKTGECLKYTSNKSKSHLN